MATIEESEHALERLSNALRGLDPAARKAAFEERTVSARLTDLDLVYTGRITDEGFADLTSDPAPRAQIRLTMTSDDLVALSRGDLSFGRAWSSGRLKVEASFGDLFRLRKLF